jgi:hypothetical protein
MKAHLARALRLLPAFVLAGCGDGGSATPAVPDASVDAAVGGDASTTRDGLGGPEAGADGPAASGLPLPVGVSPPRRFLPPKAQLVGQGFSSCSHHEPASGDGDRWCAFMTPGANGATDLWVIDLTRTAADALPPCDGSSPLCLRLTTNLWTGTAIGLGPIHPYSHEFYGDTLLFYADAVSAPADLHRGPVYAWRPGWSQARRISGPLAIGCWAHEDLLLATCWEDFTGDAMTSESFVLSAGAISATADVTLPSLGNIRPYRTGNALAWQSGFSPKGDLFVYSSADPDPAVESLHAIPVEQIGRAAPTEIVHDASSWEISPAGERVYFYRAEGVTEQRALFTADFPSGANATKLASGVHDHLLFGDAMKDQGIAFLIELSGEVGTLRFLRDPHMPATAAALFTYTSMLEDVNVSPDLRFTAWSDGHFDMRIVRMSDGRSCDLNTTAKHDAFAPAFLEHAGLVFWQEDSAVVEQQLDGFYANPDGCQGKQRFGEGVDFTIPIGDRALVFGDELDVGTSAVTLKYAALAGGAWPAAGAVRIHENVDNSWIVPVGPQPRLLVFHVSKGGPSEEGTYVFSLPF